MQQVYQNIIFLLIGLMIGLQLKLNNSSVLQSGRFESTLSDNIPNNTVAEILYNETRILCWILTCPEHHRSRSIHIKKTWGSRCNKLLFVSTQLDEELETIKFDVEEGHDNLWPKTREAFKYIYDNHFNDADWFLKADDDTFVVMENLRAFLYPMSTHSPVYFGHKFKSNPEFQQGYMAGGAYVLSKEALNRFVSKSYDKNGICQQKYKAEDFQLGMCLENIGVVAGDSRDVFARNRFLPLQYWSFLEKLVPQWYWDYQYYRENMSDFFSNTAIAFHYTPWYDMYYMEYLLYNMRPYGLEQHDNLPKKANMDILMNKWRNDRPDNAKDVKHFYSN